MRADVVALQLAPEPGEVEANLALLAQAVRALEPGADLIVAPELVNTGYDLGVLGARGPELAEMLDGPTIALLSELAAEHGATIVAGLLERDDDALYDTAVLVAPDGGLTRYRKSHLYPPERSHFVEGNELVVAASSAGRIGMMICFEHAFPEIATTLALQGAEILAIPSAVPYGYEHLLDLRTRARGQDNQVFAVAANLAGGEFCGGSLIVDPRGEVLAQADTGPTAIRATLDLSEIEREREREPALRLRRPRLYR